MEKQRKGRLIRLSALAAAVSAASAPAAAAEYVVTSKEPVGEGTLAQAIGNANESGGIDSIVFSVSGTIDMGEYSLPTVEEGVSITGPGSGSLTLRGGTSEDAIFRVNLGAGENVSISGMKVVNARYGAVQAYNGYEGGLNLSDIVVTDTGSAQYPAYDPMIAASGDADITLTGVTVKNVFVEDASPVRAVGEGSSLRVIESEVSGNTTDLFAGGIRVADDASLYLENSVVKNNTVTNDGPGGIGVKYGSNATIIDSEISGNSTSEHGGGIAVRGGGLTLRESKVSGNEAGDQGGGIYIDEGSLYIEMSEINANRLTYLEGSSGGGIYIDSADFTIWNSSVTNNRAEDGGGLAIEDAEGDIYNTIVSGNMATADGGGIYIDDDAELDFDKSVLLNNTAGGSGGGLHADDYAGVDLDFAVVRNNSAYIGGGLYFEDESDVDIEDSQIVGNSAQLGGAFVGYNMDDFDLQRSVVSNNTSKGDIGVLHVEHDYDGNNIDIERSTIADNRNSSGPAVVLEIEYDAGLDIEYSTISGNVGTNAPSILIRTNDTYGYLDIENSTFSGNRANGYRAAIVVRDVEGADIRNVTFVDNQGSGSDTTQLHLPGSVGTEGTPYIEIDNSIFASSNDAEVIVGGETLNDDGTYGADYDIDVDLVANIMTNGLMQVGESGSIDSTFGIIPTDPALGPLADNGGRTKTHAPLDASSPGVNQGVDFRPEGEDQRGANTVGAPDLGAVEYTENTPPRLVSNLTGSLSGVVGKEVDPIIVLDYFVDDEGDNISVEAVSGLPAGLTYDDECEDAICGTLTAAGEYPVQVRVVDDGDPNLERTVSAVVKVRDSAPVFIDDDDDSGSVPLAGLSLLGALAWLRRRRY